MNEKDKKEIDEELAKDKATQKKNVVYNLSMLRQKSGLSVLEFCSNTYISHASYTRYVNKDNELIPSNSVIREFCQYFNITRDQFLNTKLPDDFISTHPDIFFTFATCNEIDEQIIEQIEHHFDIRFNQIIKAFNQYELKFDFLPAEELTTSINEKEIEKEYYTNYAPENITRTLVHYYEYSFEAKDFVPTERLQYEQLEISKRYLDYYKPTYILKRHLLKEIDLTKKIPNIKVYVRKLSPLQATDENPDIYETIKTMSLNQFFKYCNNYKEQLIKTFHLDI